jgi:hypothetical protein
MAKTRFVEFKYSDNRDPDVSDIQNTGNLIILNPNNNVDKLAAESLGLTPIMVQTRGSKNFGDYTTQEVIGLQVDDHGLIIPFGSREAGQKIAQKINNHAEIVRRRIS